MQRDIRAIDREDIAIGSEVFGLEPLWPDRADPRVSKRESRQDDAKLVSDFRLPEVRFAESDPTHN
ncbi:MAG: hypothetical protein ABJ308_05575 [Halieaceae bacterium]